MAAGRFKRIFLGLGITLIVLALAGAAGMHFAVKALKGKVQEALGPESEVGEIVVGWSAIEVQGVTIHAPKGWPATDTLRAKRIVIEPDLRGLFSSKQVRINRITVEDGYLSLLRTADGHLRLLPSLLETKTGEDSAAPAIPVTISDIELKSAAVEFFDASIRKPPLKLRLEQIDASMEDLRLPELKNKTSLKLTGVVKGVRHDGKLDVAGWLVPATKDSEISTSLRGVDLAALQPYIVKAAETGVKSGSLNLDIKSTVRDRHLHAPGHATISNLELSSSSTFMGLPRQAVVASLKNRNGQITLQFVLDGNLDDPHFSLNESFAKRFGASLADGLGISLGGLVNQAGKAAGGIGGVFGKIFGQ